MLTPVEARLIASFYAPARAFRVLDARYPQAPQLCDVFVRAWAREGVVLEATSPPREQLAEYLGRQGLARGPVAVIVRSRADGQMLCDLLGECCTAQLVATSGFVVLCSPAPDTVLHSDEALQDCVPRAASVRLKLEAKGPPREWDTHLPAKLRVELPVTSRYRVLGLSGECPQTPLPAPEWHEFGCPGDVELTIDVAPGLDRDRWLLAVDPEQPRSRPLPAPPSRTALRRLVLIFDRTCPSHDQWENARRLLEDRERQPDSRYGLGTPQETVSPATLNAAIRAGLAQGFREQAQAGSLGIDVVWFADVEGDGVARPAGLNMPEQPWAWCGTVANDSLEPALEQLTYSPGLDLWDPLDQALHGMAQHLEREQTPWPILVVGNSPPCLPADPKSRFWELLRLGDIRTTVRRKTNLFLAAIQTIQRLGSPLVYLFLSGHRPTGSDNRDFLTYQAVQTHVRNALEQCMMVVEARADAEGISQALPRVFELLSGESGITIK